MQLVSPTMPVSPTPPKSEIIPHHPLPIVRETLAKQISDLGLKGLGVEARTRPDGGSSIIIVRQPEKPGGSSEEIYEIPEKRVSDWAKKNIDLDTYISFYGTIRGYEGYVPNSMLYTSRIFPVCDEVVIFVRSVLAQCSWDFIPFDFIRDLYYSWHNRHYPVEPAMDWYSFLERLIALCTLYYQSVEDGKTGWIFIENCAPMIEPTVSMRSPEPLIREYNLKNWERLRNGSCTSEAMEYDPQISDNWLHYLTDDLCLNCGLTRMCKCNLPLAESRPLFR